ncbi:hypothetical protein L9F63_004051, partial [Diploptera punctata]
TFSPDINYALCFSYRKFSLTLNPSEWMDLNGREYSDAGRSSPTYLWDSLKNSENRLYLTTKRNIYTKKRVFRRRCGLKRSTCYKPEDRGRHREPGVDSASNLNDTDSLE